MTQSADATHQPNHNFMYKLLPYALLSTATACGAIADDNPTTPNDQDRHNTITSACTDPSECPPTNNDCIERTCENQMCGTRFAEAGSPIPSKSSDNRVTKQCDGSGKAVSIANDTDPGEGMVALQVFAGWHATCAITSEGEVYCWGGDYQRPQDGYQNPCNLVPTPVTGLPSDVSTLSMGGSYVCALTSVGGVWCWGKNNYYQLGNGTTSDSTVPIEVPGLESGVRAIAAGWCHACAITANGQVACWGDKSCGYGTYEIDPIPTLLPDFINVVAISAGAYHTCAVDAAGAAFCWGQNTWGQLGDGTKLDRTVPTPVTGLDSDVIAISAGSHHSCALTSDGGVLCWGGDHVGLVDIKGSLVPVAITGLDRDISSVAAGYVESCALTSLGGLLCWEGSGLPGGNNYVGGVSLSPVVVLSEGVKAVSVGLKHTCAVLSHGGVVCWGANYWGAIGDASTDDAYLPTPVVGFR